MKFDLSVIIVNYNVEFFLEQCLNSVKKATKELNVEVFVVDNNSIDDSVEMVKRKFPEYKLIANKENLGFSKANNQAMRQAKGRYFLLLNPDTIVEEETFTKVVSFMDQHPEAGGLGVRMLDGKGTFLPESKRGLPTPAVAFYKIFGLARLFPHSKRFGHYHLGYLSEFETNEVEVLSGAFMLMRKEALDKVGLLDEDFFMYGEDIDLSYRITKGSYKNYYFPETRIIHYKGESTKKSSVNYVFVFYRAMIIFAQKHFSTSNAKFFSFLINFAIYLRAGAAILMRFVRSSVVPLFDLVLLGGGLLSMTHRWQTAGIEFPSSVLKIAIPAYTLIWLFSAFFQGAYDKPFRILKVAKGALFGTLIILVLYALLPKDWQFSRLFILLGALWLLVYFILSRWFLHFAVKGKYRLSSKTQKRFAIVGSEDEIERVEDLLKQTNASVESTFHVSSGKEKSKNEVGNIDQLDQIVHIHKIDEVIFCAKDSSAQNMIDWMLKLKTFGVDFKIAQPDSIYLIGSNSINSAGDLYVLNINEITKPESERKKRAFDLLIGLVLLLFSPILVWFYSRKKRFISNLLKIVVGSYSIVGYDHSINENTFGLPKIKKGVLHPVDGIRNKDSEGESKINLIYARDYSMKMDFIIFLSAWRKLDR